MTRINELCSLFTEKTMTEDEQPRQKNRKKLWLALAALTVILAVLFVPPFLSVSRYKSRITQLISVSLGRPVRLSSVEVRVLPRPGFLLTDLTVDEDPAYGAEPVLHANTVTASIRLLSLWRGRLEIDKISVDEASLNVVRAAAGRWNLDSLLRTATAQDQSAAGGLDKPIALPYLDATNSRINFKDGIEKLPFSLVTADLSFWQQSSGDWRIRLRGQPARTDLSIEQADTGVVRLEAQMRRAQELRQMPMHLDLEWRDAQLGQLTRLAFGSDAGWRGDLTGQLHMDGTADAAQIQTRLRATGVHRVEFAPAEPMDFDANCTLVAHFTARAIENLLCNSPLGSGHIRLTGNLPGNLSGPSDSPRFTAELDRVPLAVGLDALRTVRSGLAPGIVASGTATGKLTYAPTSGTPAAPAAPMPPAHPGRFHPAKTPPVVNSPLTGSIAVDGFQLSGNGLSEPIRVARILLEPAPSGANPASGESQGLAATVAIPLGGASPLSVSTRFELSGYHLALRGPASILRAKELAHLAGFANTASLNALAGEPLSLDLVAQGPWMALPPPVQMLAQSPAQPPSTGTLSPVVAFAPAPPADTLTGTVTLHNANWMADYLVNHVEISQATLHLAANELRWDPVVFSYGPLKGTATLSLPAACVPSQPCASHFQVQLGALDAAVIQTSFLGAHEKTTLLSTLIERLRPTPAPAWPRLEGTIKAESLILGPVTLRDPVATIATLANGAEITAFDAGLLGGRVHGAGVFHAAQTPKDKPSYKLEGQFEKLSPQAVGQMFGWRSSGGTIGGNGKIELAGFTGDDLAASATGALHFEWKPGTVAASSSSAPVPSVLARFDSWTADAELAKGSLVLKNNEVKRGAHTEPVQATVTLAERPKIAFPAPQPVQAKR
jgi:hypothetical protein